MYYKKLKFNISSGTRWEDYRPQLDLYLIDSKPGSYKMNRKSNERTKCILKLYNVVYFNKDTETYKVLCIVNNILALSSLSSVNQR